MVTWRSFVKTWPVWVVILAGLVIGLTLALTNNKDGYVSIKFTPKKYPPPPRSGKTLVTTSSGRNTTPIMFGVVAGTKPHLFNSSQLGFAFHYMKNRRITPTSINTIGKARNAFPGERFAAVHETHEDLMGKRIQVTTKNGQKATFRIVDVCPTSQAGCEENMKKHGFIVDIFEPDNRGFVPNYYQTNASFKVLTM